MISSTTLPLDGDVSSQEHPKGGDGIPLIHQEEDKQSHDAVKDKPQNNYEIKNATEMQSSLSENMVSQVLPGEDSNLSLQEQDSQREEGQECISTENGAPVLTDDTDGVIVIKNPKHTEQVIQQITILSSPNRVHKADE